jgi:release factor glutamine methyltransferase
MQADDPISDVLWRQALHSLSVSWSGLPDKPEETPQSTLRALWFAASGDPRSVEGARHSLPPLSASAEKHLHDLVMARVAGVPLAHLTGRTSFLGIEMLSSPGALIPRRETEKLAVAAIRRLDEVVRSRGTSTVLDLCCGSGNIALALAKHCPEAVIYGSDISSEAVQIARANAERLGLSERCHFFAGDLYQPFAAHPGPDSVDLITCNPPYIPSARVKSMPEEISEHEPPEAFDGGPMGLDLILRLYREALDYLRPGSWLLFEVGLGQGGFVLRRMEQTGRFERLEVISDGEGNTRGIMARTPER